MNTQPLPLARIRFYAVLLCVLACLSLHGWAPSRGFASEVEAIMAGLDADCVATADRLLALSDAANEDPHVARSFVQAARTVGRQGHWQKSISLLERARIAHQASGRSSENPDTFLYTIDLAIASAAMQCQQFDLASEHCQAVIQDRNASAQHRAAAFPLLIKALQSKEQLDDAAAILHQAVSDEQGRLAAAQLAELALPLASACLEQRRVAAASLAYQSYLHLLPDGPRVADAMLGEAWASALGAETPELAAIKLSAFVAKFPSHHDAPHAQRAMATCLDQANEGEKAEAARKQLLEAYPDSDAAAAILAKYTSENSPWPNYVRAAWLSRLKRVGDAVPSMSLDQAHAFFGNALQSGDDTLWQLGTQWLVDVDRDGLFTEALLTRFTTASDEALAEHLAIDLIAQASSTQETPRTESPAAAESACRWAGASERWSMLALAADELGAPGNRDSDSTVSSGATHSVRSIAIDRMLAESLMQTQRPADSMLWWDWLIDERGANDFATLLRGAETAVAHGDIETATRRVDSAKAASGDIAFNRSLTQILAAQLSIRRARFDEARDTLNEIVLAADPSPTLRPRAQWLVGETYFMQQRYADAIDAYRRVDAMDSAGEWAPAALLQAGKAFEKLGRGRDAVVCYTALLTRFHDWPHASIAQTRLATLNPAESSLSPAPILR